jgi:hypothetical protein
VYRLTSFRLRCTIGCLHDAAPVAPGDGRPDRGQDRLHEPNGEQEGETGGARTGHGPKHLDY